MSDRAILTYHSISEASSPLAISSGEFRRQIEALASSNVRIVPLAELLTSAAPAVALTFDDGYLDFYQRAWPILRDRNLPATVFLITSALDGGSHDGRPCMNWSNVGEIHHEGITCGAHTATHPNLAQMSQQRGEQEILDSKSAIEDHLGEPGEQFCYHTAIQLAHCVSSLASTSRLDARPNSIICQAGPPASTSSDWMPTICRVDRLTACLLDRVALISELADSFAAVGNQSGARHS